MLKVFDVVLLGEPFWYVGGVKLMFCAISLLIPVGMYFFARRHFGELSARVALLAGAFWYELAGFAHKPMTEFVAAALLMVLLVLCVVVALRDLRRYGFLLAMVGLMLLIHSLQALKEYRFVFVVIRLAILCRRIPISPFPAIR